jgi:hypothetical protein
MFRAVDHNPVMLVIAVPGFPAACLLLSLRRQRVHALRPFAFTIARISSEIARPFFGAKLARLPKLDLSIALYVLVEPNALAQPWPGSSRA